MHASSVRALSRPPPARRSRTEKAFAKATSEERCAPQDTPTGETFGQMVNGGTILGSIRGSFFSFDFWVYGVIFDDSNFILYSFSLAIPW